MSESHIKPYVWDQVELLRTITDLYIKNKDTEDGHMNGMLGDQAYRALKLVINQQILELTNYIAEQHNKSNQCTNGILEKDEFGNPTKTIFQ